MFTAQEHTTKKYSQSDAIKAARARVGTIPICTDALRRAPLKLTLSELNELVDEIVNDSYYCSGY